MERLMLSDKQDFWYLSNEKSGFILRLLLKTEPVSKSACMEAVLDNKGNPHLIIKNEPHYQHLFWNGTKWETRKLQVSHNPSSFCIHAHFEYGTHIVYIAEDGIVYEVEPYGNMWREQRLYLTAAKVEKVALLNRSEPYLLALTYCFTTQTGRRRLGLTFKNKLKWEAAKEIDIGKAEIINWLIFDSVLFVLLSDESIEKTDFHILRVDLNNLNIHMERGLLNAVRWEGQPSFIIGMDMQLKIFWQYKGCIIMANIDRENLEIKETVKTSLFYPAEIISFTGLNQVVDTIAFRKINGIYLKNPLLLTVCEFERLLKEKIKN